MRYIVLIVCIVFLILSKHYSRGKKIFIFLSALALVIFSTFRGHILGGIYKGIDYNSYYTWFNSIENIKISISNDFLFNLLMLIVYKVTGCFEVFIFITSVISICGIYKFALKNSNNYVLLIYYLITFGIYELGLSAIRQFMAISIFFMVFNYIGEKKFFKYCLGIVIASMFHSSAIILIFIYPFVNSKFKVSTKTFAAVAIAIVSTIVVKLGVYEQLLIKYVPNYIYKYAGIGSELNSNYTVFIITLFVFCITIVFKCIKKQLFFTNNSKFMYLILLLLFSYLATLHPTLGRMIQYFMPAVTLMLPEQLEILKKENHIFYKIGLLGSVLFFALIYIL